LPSNSLSGVSSLTLFPLFATGVSDTGGKFAAGAGTGTCGTARQSQYKSSLLHPFPPAKQGRAIVHCGLYSLT
jgi:hypothetical protein